MSAALVAGAWAGPIAGALAERPRLDAAAHSSYVVRSGDTLWSIAERLAPGRDPRPLVDAISATNRVDPGSIVPGQTLLIPSGP